MLFARFVARLVEDRLTWRVMIEELVEDKGYSGGQEKGGAP